MRKSLVPASLLIAVSAIMFAPSAFAATYSGYGQTSQGGWGLSWSFQFWVTVDTSAHTISLQAAYPHSYNTWTSGVTFLSALAFIQDKNGKMSFGWYSGQDHCGWVNNPNLCMWWFTTSYSTTNTGEIVNVYFYYGGVGIFGGITGTQVSIPTFAFNVGS